MIKAGKYELHPSYEELFRPQADGSNKEVIFEHQYSSPLVVHELNRNLSPASSIYARLVPCVGVAGVGGRL